MDTCLVAVIRIEYYPSPVYCFHFSFFLALARIHARSQLNHIITTRVCYNKIARTKHEPFERRVVLFMILQFIEFSTTIYMHEKKTAEAKNVSKMWTNWRASGRGRERERTTNALQIHTYSIYLLIVSLLFNTQNEKKKKTVKRMAKTYTKKGLCTIIIIISTNGWLHAWWHTINWSNATTTKWLDF